MSTFLLITREVSYMYAHLNVGLQTPGILTGWSFLRFTFWSSTHSFQSTRSLKLTLSRPSYSIDFFTHMKLCLATATHNFKWVQIIHNCLNLEQTSLYVVMHL